MKRIVLLLVSALLLSASVFADDGSNPITGNLGDDISWTIYLDKGILEINGYGDMPATGTNTSPWADHATMISLVEVGYGIESLCDYAFDNFISLQEVHLPSTMRSIGDYAFRGCTDLYSIRVLTEEETPTLGNSVFDPDLDLGGVALYILQSMFDQFADADVWMDMNLQIYKEPIPGVDDYGSLGEAGIQWFVKNGGTTLQFEGMGDIPAFTNGYVAPWDAYIPTITEVILVGDNITGINADAFASYPKLASVVLPEWFTGIGDGAFANCTLLSTIEIKYEEDVVTLGTDVFSGVDISQIVLYVPDNLVVAYRSDPTWGQMEVHAASDKPIYGSVTQSISWSISGSTLNITGLGAIPDYAEGTDAPWNEYHARIESVFVGDGITYIGNNAFAVCTNVTTATFPATLDSIGVTIFTYDDHSIDIYMLALLPPGISAATFTDLENLITVYPYESVKSLYQNHPLWGNLTIESQDNPQGSIFGVVGDGVVWSLEDGVLRFEGSGSIPNLQGEDDQPWAEYRDEIFKIYMHDAYITSIGQNAFASCSTFNEIRFSPTLTYIGYYAFRSCTGLMEINACNVPTCIGADVNAFADVTTSNISLRVPYDLKGVYQGTQVWTNFVYAGCDGGGGTQGDTREQVTIALSDTEWTFLMLSGIGRSYNIDDIVASDTVIWARYDSYRRAAGGSGWILVEDFSTTYYKDWGHIVRAKRPGTTLTLTLPENMNNMSETIHLVHTSTGGHPENANWNLIGNPYNGLYNIDGLAAVGIESPIAIWNGTGYSTYTPGIDSYKLQPFQAFFIQIPDDGPNDIQLPTDYIEDNNQESDFATVTVPGYFTVGEGKTVKFARGNLQYNPARNVWRFADYAYDIIGSGNENISDSYDGWIDLFGWGTGNHPTLTSTNGEDYSMFVDWGSNAISNAGNVPNTWRTLTSEEWDYLFFYRENASQLYGVGTVNGVKGLIVLPDEWENLPDLNFTSGGSNTVYYQLNVYTEADWGAMQAAGAMFLPTSEMRDGAELVGGDDYGYYWSSTQESVGQAHYMAFYENGVYQNNYSYSQMGHSVRLVRDH